MTEVKSERERDGGRQTEMREKLLKNREVLTEKLAA